MSRTIALVGNPNTGKTALFNVLTGSHAKVGNWPGVTVSVKQSTILCSQDTLVDLPGCYSLFGIGQERSLDEHATTEYMLETPPDLIINVLDINHLERHLYLTCQLLSWGIPMIVVANKWDQKSGVAIDLKKLSERIGCPIMPTVASEGEGIDVLRTALDQALVPSHQDFCPPEWKKMQGEIEQRLEMEGKAPNVAHRLSLIGLEFGASVWPNLYSEEVSAEIEALRDQAPVDLPLDIQMASRRYQIIGMWCEACFKREKDRPSPSRVDQWLLHRYFGLPLFLLMMYAVFFLTIQMGTLLGDALVQCFHVLGAGGQSLIPLGWTRILLVDGAWQGFLTTLSLVPSILLLFAALHALEECGYMARAAFVMDRLMQTLGLPGRAFIAMMVGFGCNVPAVMATRMLASWRERVLTCLMIPFMSCSARLAIYTVFAQICFPSWGHVVVFSLYLIGILAAILTGWVAKILTVKEETASLIMEMPAYQKIVGKRLLERSWRSAKQFLWRAIKVIVPIAMLLALLSHIGTDGHFVDHIHESWLSHHARSWSRWFAPIGLSPDNWPAIVGLILGLWAKEVVLASLTTLYGGLLPSDPASWMEVLISLWDGIKGMFWQWFHPATWGTLDPNPYLKQGLLAHFHEASQVMAYLVFITLYTPCMATVAALQREVGWRWALISVVWSLILAFSMAVLAYRMMQGEWHQALILIGVGIGISGLHRRFS